MKLPLTFGKITNQFLAVSPRKATYLLKVIFAQMQPKKFKKLHIIYTKGKRFSVADKLGRSLSPEELQLNLVKHKQLPPQVLFATLTYDDQIKLKRVNCLVKHETVLPSLKDDCHPGLAHFANDQFPIRKDEEGEKRLL